MDIKQTNQKNPHFSTCPSFFPFIQFFSSIHKLPFVYFNISFTFSGEHCIMVIINRKDTISFKHDNCSLDGSVIDIFLFQIMSYQWNLILNITFVIDPINTLVHWMWQSVIQFKQYSNDIIRKSGFIGYLCLLSNECKYMKTCNINNKLLNIFQLFVSDFSNRYGYLTVSFSLPILKRKRSGSGTGFD